MWNLKYDTNELTYKQELTHRHRKQTCTSVSLFLFCIQGYYYHLSKFHIYVLAYCNSLYLSGLQKKKKERKQTYDDQGERQGG